MEALKQLMSVLKQKVFKKITQILNNTRKVKNERKSKKSSCN